MDHNKITKQFIQLNKTAFDNTFSTMTVLHDNSEKFFFRFVDKNPLFQNNSREAVNEYILASRKRRADFKSHVDDSYEKFSDYLMSSSLNSRHK